MAVFSSGEPIFVSATNGRYPELNADLGPDVHPRARTSIFHASHDNPTDLVD